MWHTDNTRCWLTQCGKLEVVCLVTLKLLPSVLQSSLLRSGHKFGSFKETANADPRAAAFWHVPQAAQA